MSKIVIIGASAAGFSAARTLAESNCGCEITLISQENELPYNKNMLLAFLEGAAKEKDLLLCKEDFFKEKNINFLRDSCVNRIEPQKQRIALKDNTRIPYDFLIIASGKKVVLPDIPGKTKDGVFALYNLDQFRQVNLRLDIVDAVCIVGEAQAAVKFHKAIWRKDKHIKIISSHRPEAMELGAKDEWIDSSGLAEIIGEGKELKAYKLGSGKAIEASLILFVGENSVSSEFLKDSQIRSLEGYILVDELMHTNFENIFACGSVCCMESTLGGFKSWEESCNEGIIVAKNLIASLERGNSLCPQTS
jgi:NAD(P)H-nitrite reductase large subunit